MPSPKRSQWRCKEFICLREWPVRIFTRFSGGPIGAEKGPSMCQNGVRKGVDMKDDMKAACGFPPSAPPPPPPYDEMTNLKFTGQKKNGQF